jgi:hypothetical protein
MVSQKFLILTLHSHSELEQELHYYDITMRTSLSEPFHTPLETESVDIPVRRMTQFTHSPTIVAILHSNAMRDCASVREVYAECQASQSKDTICKTANAYFAACLHNDASM